MSDALEASKPQLPTTGYDASRLNALRHGILSRSTVLPWEDADAYDALLGALAAEHAPSGPTEEHLVEELAGVLWRKRRLRLAEVATYHRALQATTESHRGTAKAALVMTSAKSAKVDVASTLSTSPAVARREAKDLEADRRMTEAAIDAATGGQSYDEAVSLLDESTREAWADQLTSKPGDYEDGDVPYTADAASLVRYLEAVIMPWYAERLEDLKVAPAVRAQAIGESLDPDRLGRYEVHLDRKLERTLSTLIRLQELRRVRTTPTDPSAG